MKRLLYLSIAIVWGSVLLWFTIAWVSAFPSLGTAIEHAWRAAQSDTMVMLFLADLTIFALFVIAWLLHDMRTRSIPIGLRIAWIAGFCLVGTPVVFLYLAWRTPTK